MPTTRVEIAPYFEALHLRLNGLYDCNCPKCQSNKTIDLSVAGDLFKGLLNVAEKAFKRLHEKGSYKPQDLKTEPAYQDLINHTFDVFDKAITDNDMPELMRTALQKDAFLFGGLKTHVQLFEASTLLSADGKLKPFAELANDFNKLNNKYNQNYLEAEYEFAVGSAEVAAKWSGFSDDATRYYLQYRTAGDNKVRDEHAALNGTTLPKDDPFWDSYMPPNGWRCRCTVVEVLADKYPKSNSADSIAKGKKATTKLNKNGKNTHEMFRFNSGKDKVLFPSKSPYNATRCTGDGKLSVTGLIGAPLFLLNIEKGKCEAKKIIEEIRKENTIRLRKAKIIEIKDWAKSNIPENGLIKNQRNFRTNEVHLSRKSINNIAGHLTEPNLKEVAKNVLNNLDNCKFIESKPLDPQSKNYEKKLSQGITQFHYYEFEWDSKIFRLNTEEINGRFEKPYSANVILKK